ncbi:MAG: ATP-binding cassette domain-containing protein [Planctomycetes bacterium]|nr:ATP-binding cassette domain-containing protein [Planctomycetota bacterium]
MTDALTLDHVSKRFGSHQAVDAISMRIPAGSIYGFLGQNGAGKTTTIRMIMSIYYPDSGRITVLGSPNSESIKDRLGYLPEEKGLYKKMKANELLAYFGMLKGVPKADAKVKANQLLKSVGLGEFADHRCEQLSKGMGQKVQILATIMHDPELVILDEPFSGLDPVNVEMMREVILKMKRDGRTVIFSTHVMENAEKLCDGIVMIHRGKKVLDGTLAEVKSGGDRGIQIDYDGSGEVLRELPGITRINDSGKHAEIFLAAGTDPQEILKRLVGRLVIRRFDLREPSLHEVFFRAVKGDSHE